MLLSKMEKVPTIPKKTRLTKSTQTTYNGGTDTDDDDGVVGTDDDDDVTGENEDTDVATDLENFFDWLFGSDDTDEDS